MGELQRKCRIFSESVDWLRQPTLTSALLPSSENGFTVRSRRRPDDPVCGLDRHPALLQPPQVREQPRDEHDASPAEHQDSFDARAVASVERDGLASAVLPYGTGVHASGEPVTV